MRKTPIWISLLSLTIGCTQLSKKNETSTATSPEPSKARAVIKAAPNEKLTGAVEFTRDGELMKVTVKIQGLKPGVHGFHIHEKGDCSSADFTSAGPHFNPENTAHGAPEKSPQHAGDLGNVVADKSGVVATEFTVKNLTLSESPFKIVGRAIIIHQDPDDLKTQPTGNSGKRIGCGVIETVLEN